MFGDFSDKRYPFLASFSKFRKSDPGIFFMKMRPTCRPTMFRDLKKNDQNCGTSLYVLKFEYTPGLGVFNVK